MINVRTFKMVSVLALLFVFTLSCSKDEELAEGVGVVTVVRGVETCDTTGIPTVSDWTFPLGNGNFLRHTAGLTEMALTGNHGVLNNEQCNTATHEFRVPTEIRDDHDIYDVGLATQRVYGNFVVAMYHPIPQAPDHFIVYNHTNGDWVHWKLASYPTIQIEGKGGN